MNPFNNTERRTRVKKPISLIIISFLLILSLIYNYYLQLLIRDLPLNWVSIQSLRFTGLEIAFLLLPVICGIGLYFIKKWAWYLFIVYSIVLIIFNIYATIVNPVKFNFYSLFESTLIFLGAAYFLRKDISAPYLKMYPRGWRGEKRTPIQIQVKVDGYLTTSRDISPAGMYVDYPSPNFATNQNVLVEFAYDGQTFLNDSGIVRVDPDGVGIAFRDLTSENEKLLMKLT